MNKNTTPTLESTKPIPQEDIITINMNALKFNKNKLVGYIDELIKRMTIVDKQCTMKLLDITDIKREMKSLEIRLQRSISNNTDLKHQIDKLNTEKTSTAANSSSYYMEKYLKYKNKYLELT